MDIAARERQLCLNDRVEDSAGIPGVPFERSILDINIIPVIAYADIST